MTTYVSTRPSRANNLAYNFLHQRGHMDIEFL